eukprot:12319616-Alexandrium_andersonii.AAC.1
MAQQRALAAQQGGPVAGKATRQRKWPEEHAQLNHANQLPKRPTTASGGTRTRVGRGRGRRVA